MRISMTEQSELHFSHVLLVLTLVFGSVSSQNGCDNPDGIQAAGSDYCYVFHNLTETWSDAHARCDGNNGQLPVITDEVASSALRTLLSNRGLDSVWLGAMAESENRYNWHWTSDNSQVDSQGCFTDKLFEPDLPDAHLGTQTASLTDRLCVEECKNPSNGHAPYQYAGLQSGDTCYCGDTYGRHGLSSTTCNFACPGDTSRLKCGGSLDNAIYYVNGSYAEWTANQPNDVTESCAVIDEMIGGKRLYSDEHCNQEFPYLCQIEGATCPTDPGYSDINGKCYYWSDSSALNWFLARQDCVQKGGDLVKISDEPEREAIAGLLNTESATGKHWIGLTKLDWKWMRSGGSEESVLYVDLSSVAPSVLQTTNCLTADSADDYRWRSGSCTQTLPVVCQYNYNPVTATPSSIMESSPMDQSTDIPTDTTSLPAEQSDTLNTSPVMNQLGSISDMTSSVLSQPDATQQSAVQQNDVSTAVTETTQVESTTTVILSTTTSEAQVIDQSTPGSTADVSISTAVSSLSISAVNDLSALASQPTAAALPSPSTTPSTSPSTLPGTLASNIPIDSDTDMASSTNQVTAETSSMAPSVITSISSLANTPVSIASEIGLATSEAGHTAVFATTSTIGPSTTQSGSEGGSSTITPSSATQSVTSSVMYISTDSINTVYRSIADSSDTVMPSQTGSVVDMMTSSQFSNDVIMMSSEPQQRMESSAFVDSVIPSVTVSAIDDVTDVTTGSAGTGNTVTDPQVGQSTDDDDDDLSTFQIVLIIAFCILAAAIVITTLVFIYFNKKKGQQVAPSGGGEYKGTTSPPRDNGDIFRNEEESSTVGLVMQPNNDVFT